MIQLRNNVLSVPDSLNILGLQHLSHWSIKNWVPMGLLNVVCVHVTRTEAAWGQDSFLLCVPRSLGQQLDQSRHSFSVCCMNNPLSLFCPGTVPSMQQALSCRRMSRLQGQSVCSLMSSLLVVGFQVLSLSDGSDSGKS